MEGSFHVGNGFPAFKQGGYTIHGLPEAGEILIIFQHVDGLDTACIHIAAEIGAGTAVQEFERQQVNGGSVFFSQHLKPFQERGRQHFIWLSFFEEQEVNDAGRGIQCVNDIDIAAAAACIFTYFMYGIQRGDAEISG